MQGPLDLVLEPHGPLDAQQAMAAEAETLVVTADLKLVRSTEAQNQSVAEKPEVFSTCCLICFSVKIVTQSITTLHIFPMIESDHEGA